MRPKNKVLPWPRPKTPPTTVLVGVGWYTEDEWAKVKASAVVARRFEATYAEWVEMAEQALAELRATDIAAYESYVKAMKTSASLTASRKARRQARSS